MGIAIVAITIGSLLRLLTPQPTPVPVSSFVSLNSDSSQTVFNEITYTGTEKEFPKELDVAQLQPLNTSNDELIERLTQTFSLKPSPFTSQILLGPEYSLTPGDLDNQFILTRKANSAAGKITYDAALPVAQTFLNTNFPNLALTPLTSEVIYSLNQPELAIVSAEEAELVQIPFTYLIDGLPLYYQKQAKLPFVITVSADAKIQRAIITPLSFTPVVQEKVSIILVAQALENINTRNLGSVISAYFNGPKKVEISSLVSGKMTDVVIEYRFDEVVGLAYPFYRFSGTAANAEGTDMKVEIITPAVLTSPVK